MLSNIKRCYLGIPGIYAIIANDYGKIYVGSSVNLYKRINHHINYLKKNKHNNIYLQRFYNKYGTKSLEVWILKIFDATITNKKLKEYEQIYVNLYYDSHKQCFNLSNDTFCLTASKEGKLSQSNKMKLHWIKNKKILLPTIMENLKKARKALQNMAKAGIKCKRLNKKKELSPETIIKMKKSAIRRGRNSATSVNMFSKHWNFIKSFQCMRDAAIELSGNCKSGSNISAVCRGKRAMAFGYRWEYCKT